VRESGVDPGMTPVRHVPPPRAAVRDGGEVVAGAATGAIVGAAVSSPRRTGEGLVLGAIFGSLIGAAAQENHVQSAEQAYARRLATQQVPMDNFRRAMGACMSERGYRVGGGAWSCCNRPPSSGGPRSSLAPLSHWACRPRTPSSASTLRRPC